MIKQENDIINDAKIKARNILLDAKEEANEMLKNIENLSNNKELNKLKNNFNQKIKNIKLESSISSTNSLLFEELKPNMEVFVTSLQQNGIVLSYSSKSKEVQVQVGSLKINVPIESLAKPNINKVQKFSK